MIHFLKSEFKVVQRHLVTKHQVKREETPAIPQYPVGVSPRTSISDLKPYFGHPYYSHPPWLSHHDYNSYYQGGPYANFIMDAQNQMVSQINTPAFLTENNNNEPEVAVMNKNAQVIKVFKSFFFIILQGLK